MKLNWNKQKTGGYKAIDNNENEFFMPANKETCECILKEGNYGSGWTPGEAYNNACVHYTIEKKQELLDTTEKPII